MRIGAVYPQTEMWGEPDAVRALATGVEELGYDALLAYDHVLGAQHADRDPPLWGPYTEHDPFQDPFVLFGHLAAVTERIELATAVVILPQRQTALVARQAADVDLLSGGRLRLGVGTGWNHVEYDALGQDFATRGARIDEQIAALRRWWSEPLVSLDGRFDRVERAAIVPRPSRAIPIWVGGFSEPAFRRGGRLGDGFVFAGQIDRCLDGLERVRHHLGAAGRPEEGFGSEAIVGGDVDQVVDSAKRWRDAGGTHLAVVTMRRGYRQVAEHLAHLAEVKRALDAALADPGAGPGPATTV